MPSLTPSPDMAGTLDFCCGSRCRRKAQQSLLVTNWVNSAPHGGTERSLHEFRNGQNFGTRPTAQ
jgi:hypothetical protein